MTNPYGITEFDAAGAISALQAARSNRIREMLLQRQLGEQEREAGQRRDMSTAIAEYFGGGTSATPGAPATPSPAPAPSTPGVAGAVDMYGATPSAPAAGPVPAVPAAAPAAAPASPAGDLSRLTGRLLAIDPEHAAPIIAAFRGMDEAQAAQAQRRINTLGRAAYHLLNEVPENEWSAEFQRMAPVLIENGGVTRQQLAQFQLSRGNLQHIFDQAQDTKTLFEAARPHPVPVTQGGSLIDTNSIDPATGRPRVLYESPTVEVGGDVYARPQTMRQAPPNEAQLRAQAAEAIRNGADPTQVNQRLEQMLRGGAGQPGPQTFP